MPCYFNINQFLDTLVKSLWYKSLINKVMSFCNIMAIYTGESIKDTAYIIQVLNKTQTVLFIPSSIVFAESRLL